ncbi:DEAD/DEAH box helicase family protein [Flavihumibacter stibioxidans]|uniref:Restriction endonuclease subunit R n=1 Tax=Flavihumibacter stibioxidans TaxID=1834163 RepID=A0ABR7ME37_9BACT|nr:DEAD/DEAH box helicase family protein [Flavihumibacter stibioxidans]MBC6493030.1 restriction endonuclease subunit R [Flavihumibacter stibioxidans]
MNQNPEQIARDAIDLALTQCGWVVQNKSQINLGAAPGVAVREWQTDVGPADYVLFVDRKPVGLIEAKREEEAVRLTMHEEQSNEYRVSKLKHLQNDPLLFVYESTGYVSRFTDYGDPRPRSRPVFSFHRPENFRERLRLKRSLRDRLQDLPKLDTDGLRDCQINAITNLEVSFKSARPRALVQMATGSGKTFTAITCIYRLLKFSKAKRILFLVDTKNLGEQAEQEFMSFMPNDDNRKFTELYNVQRLKSSYVAPDSQVCISTIQRLYSLLKGTELPESAETENPNESSFVAREPVGVVYNERLPIDFFDFIVIDECHRSIYNIWKQVVEYFDAFQVGLTATPDNRTFGYFNQNVVSEYGYEEAVLDGVLVPYNVYLIETEISRRGSSIWKGEYVDKREKLSRRKRWEQLDEDITYSAKQLDDDVVNPSQIRTIIRAFREHWREMFPQRDELPKTLIFAKTDSHADDIINTVREEFEEGNEFCKKITYGADDPKGTLAQFRNNFHPRIAVTVDMIAVGTDVKPLEIVFFLRDVKSRSYFEQMKGRGTRTVSLDELRSVTPSATYAKDHFVIIDAVGVSKSVKTDSRPLERKPSVPLKDLLQAVAVGAKDEDIYTSLANRLLRLNKQMTEKEHQQLESRTGGLSLQSIARNLLDAYDPDTLQEIREKVEERMGGAGPEQIEIAFREAHDQLLDAAGSVFNGELNLYIDNVRKVHEQIIDVVNIDQVTHIGWDKDQKEKAEELILDFKSWLEAHKDEITALQIFYNQPYRRRELTYALIRDLAEQLKSEKPLLAPLRVWEAFEQLHGAQGSVKNDLIALVSLVRHFSGLDPVLTIFDKTVDSNFKTWVFKQNAGRHNRFTEEQMHWLRMIKDHVATSFHIERDDFDYSPFNAQGGLGKMWQLFGEDTDGIIGELNEILVA